MNKLLWQLHSWMGLIAGIGLLIIGVTGSLLIFHNELDKASAPEVFLVRPGASPRLPLDTLLAGVEKNLPDCVITSWEFSYEPSVADRVFVVRHHRHERQLVTVNPYTGAILAGPLEGRRMVTDRLMELHYTFFAGGAGELAAGLLAALLCLLGLSGAWIYREFWSNCVRFRWRAGWHILFSDLHKTVGIASVIFQLILGFTGAYWNIPGGIRHWRYRGGQPPELPVRNWSRGISMEALLNRARVKLPGFQATFIGFPTAPGADIQIYGRMGSSFRSYYGSGAIFDSQTGAGKVFRDMGKASFRDQIIDTFRPLHYGTFGGFFVKFLWCVGGLTPGLLAITGFLMWRQRRFGGRLKN